MISQSRSRTIHALVLLAFAGGATLFVAGCGEGSGERVVATEPQAENQKARTREQEVAHMIKMLKYEDVKKVNRAIRFLGMNAADSASALPALEEVATKHADEKTKTEARNAIEQIKAAKKP